MNQPYPGIRLSPAEMEQLKRLLANQGNRDVGFEPRPGILPENSDPGFMPRGDGIAPALSSLPTVNTVPSEPVDYPTIKNDSPYGYQMKRGATTGAPVPYGAPYGYSADSAPMPTDLPTINPDPSTSERARLATGTPNDNAYPMSAADRLRMTEATPVEDQNGRFKSGLLGLARPVHPSDSVGNLIGQRLAGLASGLLNPKWDEEAQREKDLAEQRAAAKDETEADKEKREQEEGAARTDLLRAQADKARVPVEPDAHYFKQGGITYRVIGNGAAEAVSDAQGKMLPPDPDEPIVREVIGEDKVSKEPVQWNRQTQKWEAMTVNGKPVKSGYVEPISATTGMKPSEENAVKDRQELLRLRRVAMKQSQSIQKQRLDLEKQRLVLDKQSYEQRKHQIDLNESELKAQYPGLGRHVNRQFVLDKLEVEKKKLGKKDVTEEDVRNSLIELGYDVEMPPNQ